MSIYVPAIERDDSKVWLDWAFQHDFDTNGPSLFRMMRTMFVGWKRCGTDHDVRVRTRFAEEAAKLKHGYGAARWAMEKYLAVSNERVSERIGGHAAEYPMGRPLEPQTFVYYRNW